MYCLFKIIKKAPPCYRVHKTVFIKQLSDIYETHSTGSRTDLSVDRKQARVEKCHIRF